MSYSYFTGLQHVEIQELRPNDYGYGEKVLALGTMPTLTRCKKHLTAVFGSRQAAQTASNQLFLHNKAKDTIRANKRVREDAAQARNKELQDASKRKRQSVRDYKYALKLYLLSRQDRFWGRRGIRMRDFTNAKFVGTMDRIANDPVHGADMAAMRRGEQCREHGGEECFHVCFKYQGKWKAFDLKQIQQR